MMVKLNDLDKDKSTCHYISYALIKNSQKLLSTSFYCKQTNTRNYWLHKIKDLEYSNTKNIEG